MAWTFNASHGLSSTPTAVVVVDTTDTSFGANGTPKDLIGGADMAIDEGVTVETGGDWGTGFETKADGSFDFLGLRWTVGPACGLDAAENGGTIVLFVNAYTSGSIIGQFDSANELELNAGAPAFALSSPQFTADTAWSTATAFCHALAYQANTSAKALYALQTADDLAADGSATPDNVGSDATLSTIGGRSGAGNTVCEYFQVLVFDEIVSDADLQAIFDNPLIFVSQGNTGSGTPAAEAAEVEGTGEVSKSGAGTPAAQAAAVDGAGTVLRAAVSVALTGANQLRDINQDPYLSLSGIRWEWYDTQGATDGEPIDSGTFATDENGDATIEVEGSALNNGEFGQLVVYHPTDNAIRGIYRLAVSV